MHVYRLLYFFYNYNYYVSHKNRTIFIAYNYNVYVVIDIIIYYCISKYIESTNLIITLKK